MSSVLRNLPGILVKFILPCDRLLAALSLKESNHCAGVTCVIYQVGLLMALGMHSVGHEIDNITCVLLFAGERRTA